MSDLSLLNAKILRALQILITMFLLVTSNQSAKYYLKLLKLKKYDLQTVFLITLGEQMNFVNEMKNNFTSFFNRINLVAILSYIELLWSKICFHNLATQRDLNRILIFTFTLT